MEEIEFASYDGNLVEISSITDLWLALLHLWFLQLESRMLILICQSFSLNKSTSMRLHSWIQRADAWKFLKNITAALTQLPKSFLSTQTLDRRRNFSSLDFYSLPFDYNRTDVHQYSCRY